MSNQEWYAVLRHRWGNPDTRFAVTCPYCRTLSTLPADGTLARGGLRGWEPIWRSQTLYRSGFRVLGSNGAENRFKQILRDLFEGFVRVS